MLAGVFSLGKSASGLDHYLGSYRFPIQVGGIFFGEDFKGLVADVDGIVGGLDVFLQIAEYGVVLKKVGQSLCVSKVVDRDEFDFRMMECGAHDIASDASEPIDPDFDCHSVCSPKTARNSLARKIFQN